MSLHFDARYPTRYSDGRGVEVTEFNNDGSTLSIRLRGVAFSGPDFDGLEPERNSSRDSLTSFTLSHGCLCECTFECRIPIPVICGETMIVTDLNMRLDLGAPIAPDGRLDREDLNLSLELEGRSYRSSGQSGGFFENELLSLQAGLPPQCFMKACINCAYSDYPPGGHGLLGGMACFRNLKAEYAKATDKAGICSVWHLQKHEMVQEIFLCPEFERRRPNTGYRG